MKTSSERVQSILEKAEVQQKIETRNRKRKIIAIVSSIAAAVIAFNLVLFVPYTTGGVNISKYRSSEYYGVIEKLYGKTHSPHKTNNFTEWGGRYLLALITAVGHRGMAASPSSEGAAGYQEVTLNQVDGVIEGDLFKRSDKHIFYLAKDIAENNYKLYAYTLDGEKSEQVNKYEISAGENTYVPTYYKDGEMFLSGDASTVTVVFSCCKDSGGSYTAVVSLDVSDLSNIKEKSRAYISGVYMSSRIVDGRLLVLTNFAVRSNVDYGTESNFVPHTVENGENKLLPLSDIVCPNEITSARYTVIGLFDDEYELADTVALLSFSSDVYVSQNNVYATRGSSAATEIRIVPYGDGELGDTRSVTVDGNVLNRYSLDEYDGMLRAVTTLNVNAKCNLYCIDLATLEMRAKVEGFAPSGESVKSARFDGNTVYVCTAEEIIPSYITDPVFVFDLSDLDNITYKDTGTIPGYSLSLTKFAYDTLLGIGYGDSRSSLKIELYEQTDTNVVPVAKYELDGARFSEQVKAHMIDAEKGLIGMGVWDLRYSTARYKLFLYDGYDIIELRSIFMNTTDCDTMRATVVDGYLYVFGRDYYLTKFDFKVIKIA